MISNLRKEIEDALHQQLKTPKDFDLLRERIYARLHVLISRTTLMRIWGINFAAGTIYNITFSLLTIE